jgi:hypothetical protein
MWVFLYKFIEKLNRLLFLKNIWLCNSFILSENNILFLDLYLFFQTLKISFYKKKFLRKINSNFLKFKKIIFLFKVFTKTFKLNLFFIKLNSMNVFLNKKILKFFYKKLKPFVSTIFSRRFNFFIDFIKLSTLFFLGKIDIKVYIQVIGRIFKFLSKRLHNRFLSFVKLISNSFLELSSLSSISGLKFIINGKFQGKDRSSSKLVLVGNVPNQTISKNIEYSLCHVYTLYGAFGLRFWVFKK